MNWFISNKEHELRETRKAWEEVEALWRQSELARIGVDGLALALFGDLITVGVPLPEGELLSRLLDTTIDLLDHEEIGPIEPAWPVIANSITEAVEFRKLIAHRRRWASQFDHLLRVIRTYLLGVWIALIEACPQSCFDPDGTECGLFDVPLIELVERPAEMIERLVVFPLADEVVAAELFTSLRTMIGRNLRRASGASPTASWAKQREWIVMPTRHRQIAPSGLAAEYLADTPFLSLLESPVPFSLSQENRFEHAHIVGGTGHGKTQLLQRMIHADLLAATSERRSVVVIDSQGDLISKLVRLDLFDLEREGSLADRLILIDPTDVEHPAALNLFDTPLGRLSTYSALDRERVLNGVVELYETFFGDLLGAELTQKQGVIFRYLARLMIAIPGASIHTLMHLMDDGASFRPQMERLDGAARYFFAHEFFDPSFAATKKQILKRLWGVLATPAFERMFAQPENKLDLFNALNEGCVILVNTAKDLLKDEGSQLFGRFFIALLKQAALERSTVPESERTPTFVYVDEAQEYFDDRVETILTQGRKYKVGFTAAHQTLDQLSPRLRSVFHANTSFKAAGGVSAKDARQLADELHTSAEFIEGARRRGNRTEFAAWMKHVTPHAIRLTVQLGHLERQPTLTEEAYDELIARNRARYCGTLASVEQLYREDPPVLAAPSPPANARPPLLPRLPSSGLTPVSAPAPAQSPVPLTVPDERGSGKGGPKHRYVQSLAKELAEVQGFRAVIEEALPNGGQVDVALRLGDVRVAVEVSVTTPAAWERENIRKCVAAGFGRVALVLAKSSQSQTRYKAAVLEGLTPHEQSLLTFLLPEELPDFIAGLAPLPTPEATEVKGYKVTVSRTAVSPEDAKRRRDALARLVARSLAQSGE